MTTRKKKPRTETPPAPPKVLEMPFLPGDKVSIQGVSYEGIVFMPGRSGAFYSLIEFPQLGVKRWIPRSRIQIVERKEDKK